MCESVVDLINKQISYGIKEGQFCNTQFTQKENRLIKGNTGRSTFEMDFQENKITLIGYPRDLIFEKILIIFQNNIDALPVVEQDHGTKGYNLYVWFLNN
ncbi:MAG: hypothetical protein V1851_02625 [Patescibacteria group bacterium]